MSYWFHRNPLKATSTQTFELRGVSTDDKTRKIFSDLRQARNKLLELQTDPNHDKATLEEHANTYFSIMFGMIDTEHFAEESGENKLRRCVKYKWSNSLLGTSPMEQWDAVFDVASMLINQALWYTKHAAKLAAKENPDMEEAKEVHKCLRTAAGMFTFVKEDLIGRLSDNTINGADTDSRVLDAYILQCTAEAQEVTLARAVELKHSNQIVAALAFESAKMYEDADNALQSLDEKTFAKWRKYFQLKNKFYMAYAHCYNGEMLLAEDKAGEAVRGLQEAVKFYKESEDKCREYASTKGVGTFARPANHLFFRKLGPVVKRSLEKCDRENGMIYHQKVAYDPPILQLKATYGLVAPEKFEKPALYSLWTKEVYDKMNARMAPKQPTEQEAKKEKKKEEELKPVQEKETPMSEKDPGNFSGCTVS